MIKKSLNEMVHRLGYEPMRELIEKRILEA